MYRLLFLTKCRELYRKSNGRSRGDFYDLIKELLICGWLSQRLWWLHLTFPYLQMFFLSISMTAFDIFLFADDFSEHFDDCIWHFLICRRFFRAFWWLHLMFPYLQMFFLSILMTAFGIFLFADVFSEHFNDRIWHFLICRCFFHGYPQLNGRTC